jgi:glycosyltransferase involved in cell wall biosynthesis
MTFAIITHVPHIVEQNRYFAYAPYVREMNIWSKYVDKVILVAPLANTDKSLIDCNYEHQNIEFVAIESFDVLTFTGILKTILKAPRICLKIFSTMKKADHIHLRCPGNIGLLGSIVQVFFPKKVKTAKYAGNWDPKSKQPLTYRLQKWILATTFITRNMQVLVYGEWEGSSTNIKPFFTASYIEAEKSLISTRDFKAKICFIFVGALVTGKKPLYAIQLVELLSHKGFDVALTLYGEGKELASLDGYIAKNGLKNLVSLVGNQTQETVKKAYKSSHFVILPSHSEGWPKAIAEGMFWGCVPVATPVSCVPFMLDFGNRGVLLEIDLQKDVLRMETLLKNENEYQNMSLRSSDWSRQFTIDVFEMEIRKMLAK